jgi:hypothetical protein
LCFINSFLNITNTRSNNVETETDFFEIEEEIFESIASNPIFEMNRKMKYPDLSNEDIRSNHRTLCTDQDYIQSKNKYTIFENKMKAQNAAKLKELVDTSKREAELERIAATRRRQIEYDQLLENRKAKQKHQPQTNNLTAPHMSSKFQNATEVW